MYSNPRYISQNSKSKDKITQAPRHHAIKAYKKCRSWAPLLLNLLLYGDE